MAAAAKSEADVPEVVSTPEVKMATVLGLDNHECNIGGVRYIIELQKSQNVPEDVAMILASSKIVARTK